MCAGVFVSGWWGKVWVCGGLCGQGVRRFCRSGWVGVEGCFPSIVLD